MPTLTDAINGLVQQRLRRALETGEMVNVPDLASEIAESLADLIVNSGLPEEQARLVAHVVEQLDRFVAKKRRGGGCNNRLAKTALASTAAEWNTVVALRPRPAAPLTPKKFYQPLG